MKGSHPDRTRRGGYCHPPQRVRIHAPMAEPAALVHESNPTISRFARRSEPVQPAWRAASARSTLPGSGLWEGRRSSTRKLRRSTSCREVRRAGRSVARVAQPPLQSVRRRAYLVRTRSFRRPEQEGAPAAVQDLQTQGADMIRASRLALAWPLALLTCVLPGRPAVRAGGRGREERS